MKCLSLWQPWATLIEIGAKRIETRSWPTKYRGELLIHAAARWGAAEVAQCYQPHFVDALRQDATGSPVERGTVLEIGALSVVVRTTRGKVVRLALDRPRKANGA